MHTRQASRQRRIDEEIEAFEGSISGRTPMDKGSDLEVLDIVVGASLSMVLPSGEIPITRCRRMVVTEDSEEEEIVWRERGEGNLGPSGGEKSWYQEAEEEEDGFPALKCTSYAETIEEKERALGKDDAEDEDEEMTEAERQEHAVAKRASMVELCKDDLDEASKEMKRTMFQRDLDLITNSVDERLGHQQSKQERVWVAKLATKEREKAEQKIQEGDADVVDGADGGTGGGVEVPATKAINIGPVDDVVADGAGSKLLTRGTESAGIVGPMGEKDAA
ncbi:hypothetical protein GIB67_042703 [Kingdonia uniflora]|uniref:Uncharacterized protein n=1 Tax=Kingdonia uniflora TaxID=39325 RepID=A0A7J7NDR1_9MAGN|nr:hypothetical protein GIB67_042703 [Kingdonia uniflora]